MNLLQIAQIAIIIACVILIVLIVSWFNKRHSVCGNKDILCYITGEPTTLANIIQYT